jgi:LuxR family maltose regulon positive regulatory protein
MLNSGARLEEFVRANPEFVPLERSIQARISVLRGDPEAALDWARSVVEDPDPASLFTWTDVPAITRIRVLTAAGNEVERETAIEELHALGAACEEWNFVGHSIDIAVLQALASSRQGRISEATESLERAVALARAGRWIRPFLEAGPEMRLLLSRLRLRDEDREFVRCLDDAFERWSAPVAEPSPQAAPQPVHQRPAPSPTAELTSRELDVLELLAERLHDKEIASRLYITTHTVNHHLKRIYRKLGVSGRRQAVRHAIEHGILRGQPRA